MPGVNDGQTATRDRYRADYLDKASAHQRIAAVLALFDVAAVYDKYLVQYWWSMVQTLQAYASVTVSNPATGEITATATAMNGGGVSVLVTLVITPDATGRPVVSRRKSKEGANPEVSMNTWEPLELK